MRTITRTSLGVLELNYMWLPTWIGLNAALKADLEKVLTEKALGWEMTEENLDDINDLVVDYLEKLCPMEGLRDYLDGLKFVQPRLAPPSTV